MSRLNIYNKLLKAIGNVFGVCGLMGNLQVESNFKSNNLQNSFQTKFNMTDEEYTKAVDNNTYTNFVKDSAGYGLAQWTYWTRKQNLLNFAKSKGVSIGDEDMQIEFLIKELKGYKDVWNTLVNAKSISEASYVVLTKYERPANQSVSVQKKRCKYGEAIYKEFVKDKEEIKMEKPSVCIDPGHYGKYNRCPSIPAYYESEIVWKLSYLQKKYLEALGISVIMTRSNEKLDLGLYDRGMKSKGCSLFISNHTNAVGSGMNETVDYAAVYYLTDDSTTLCDDISKEFAGKIAQVISNVMGLKQGYKVLTRKAGNDRNGDGIMNDNYYGVLHGARCAETPGMILEHSFHTNSKTVEWLLDDSNLDKLAKAEAECIASYLLGKKVQTSSSNTTSSSSNQTFPSTPFSAKVLVSDLNYRSEPKMDNNVKGQTGKGIFTIIEVKDGWGKLKSGAGWIYLENKDYVTILNKVTSDKTSGIQNNSYIVRVEIPDLNIRKGPGTNYPKTGKYTGKGLFTIVEESTGTGSKTKWGKLKSGEGWISLDYATKIK